VGTALRAFAHPTLAEETDAVRIPLLEETNDRIGGWSRQKILAPFTRGRITNYGDRITVTVH
jgi:hypothetical protein